MAKNKILILIISAIFISCGMKTRCLRKDSGKVPVKGYRFSNRDNFSENIFKTIDGDYIYKLTDMYYCDKNLNKIEKGHSIFSNWILLLQFYKNGCVRRFPEKFSSPNPEVVGNRGIIYTKNKQIYIDICEGMSNNRMVINTYLVFKNENLLFVVEKNKVLLLSQEQICFVFEKSEKISSEWNIYDADW